MITKLVLWPGLWLQAGLILGWTLPTIWAGFWLGCGGYNLGGFSAAATYWAGSWLRLRRLQSGRVLGCGYKLGWFSAGLRLQSGLGSTAAANGGSAVAHE